MPTAVGVLLATLGAVGAAASVTPSSSPDGYAPVDEPYENELILVTALSLTALAALLLLAVIAALFSPCGRRVPLSALLCVSMFSCMCAVAVIAWVVSYSATSDELYHKAEIALGHALAAIDERLTAELSQGLEMLLGLRGDVRNGDVVLTGAFPDAHRRLLSALASKAYGRGIGSLAMLYFGVKGNGDPFAPGGPALSGIKPLRDAADHVLLNEWVVCTQPEYKAHTPSFIVCPARDRSDCGNYTCGSSVDGDFKCQATCSGANVARGNATVTLPERSSAFCTWFPGSEKRRTSYFTAEFDQMNSPLHPPSFLPNAAPVPYLQRKAFEYNPMERPWWHNFSRPLWSAPYAFASTGQIGFTTSIGAYSPAGEFVGTLAVDYTLAVMRTVLTRVKPTPRASIVVVDLSGNVVASSFKSADLAEDTGVPTGKVINYHDISNRSASVFVQMVRTFLDAAPDGELDGVFRMGRIKFYRRSSLLVASALGGDHIPQLVVMASVPEGDVMDDTSVRSFVLALAVSFVMSVLMFLVVRLLLAPLHKLSQRMKDVSEMRLELAAQRPSRIAEVAEMQVSFEAMAATLRDYKEYLPQTLLTGGTDTGSFAGSQAADDIMDYITTTGASTTDFNCILSEAPSQGFGASEKESCESSQCESDSAGYYNNNNNNNNSKTPLARPMVPTNASAKNLFDMALHDRRVTMMVVRGRFSTAADTPRYLETHSDFLAHVLATTRQLKGVVDRFSGDAVVVGFNTSQRSSNYKAHAVDAAVGVQQATALLPGLRVHVGLAAGKAKMGNMGCPGLKKYTVVGLVMDMVEMHADLAAAWQLGCVAEEAIICDRPNYQYRALHTVATKGVVYMAIELRGGGVEEQTPVQEWMYQLESATEMQEYDVCNRAIQIIFKGELAEAVTVLEGASTDSVSGGIKQHVCSDLDNLVEWVRHLQRQGVTKPRPVDLDRQLKSDAQAWLSRGMGAASSPPLLSEPSSAAPSRPSLAQQRAVSGHIDKKVLREMKALDAQEALNPISAAAGRATRSDSPAKSSHESKDSVD